MPATVTPTRPKRRRLLVDPELQIGMSTEMVGWIYVYFLAFAVVANVSNVHTILTTDVSEASYLAALDEIRGFARFVVLPMGVTFVAMAIHGVYLTHRIAGPVVRLKRTMREIATHKLPAPISLRTNDHFKDLADETNAAIAVLREDATRRQQIGDEVVQSMQRLVRSLEDPTADRGEALALAHGALDSAETLARHLAVASDAAGDAAAARSALIDAGTAAAAGETRPAPAGKPASDPNATTASIGVASDRAAE